MTRMMNHPNVPPLEVGTKLWRGVNIIGKKEIARSEFPETRGNTTVLRTIWGSGWCTKEWVADGRHKKGLVCFCNEPIPENWTYFEVVHMNANGTSIIVRPVVGSQEELLAQYSVL